MQKFKNFLYEFATNNKKSGPERPDKKQSFMQTARQIYAHHQKADHIAAHEGYSGEAADRVDDHYEKASAHFGDLRANHGDLFKHLSHEDRENVYHHLAHGHPDQEHSKIYDQLKAGKKLESYY